MSDPNSLAVLASVGLHAIFFAFLPLLPSFSRTTESGPEEPVPLVELSPQEQRRLPSIERSPISLLPPIGQTDSFGVTPPPPTGNLFPNLAPRRPSIGAIPPRTRVIPQVPVRRSPFPSGIRIRPPVDAPSSVARGPLTQPSPPPGQTDSDASSGETNNGQVGVSGDIPELSSLGTGTVQTEDADSTSAEDLQPDSSADGDSTDGEDVAANPTPPEASEEPEPPPVDMQAMRGGYAYDPADTDNAAATSGFESWLKSAQEATENPDLLPESPITVSIDAPPYVCLTEEPVDASVAALVDPDGQLVGEPSLLKSTGYPALNQQVLDAIYNYGFPGADDYKAYSFRVEVSYNEEACQASVDGSEAG